MNPLTASFAFLITTALALPVVAQSCAPVWQPGPASVGVWRDTATPGAAGVNATCEWDPDGPGPLTPVFVFGGYFEVAGKTRANNVVTFDPATGAWAPLGSGTSGSVTCLLPLANGELIVGGLFQTAGTAAVNGIARWNGNVWSPLGGGLQSRVGALQLMPNGDVVAAGSFTNSAHPSIARWNGLTWSPVGSGINGSVFAMALLPNGDLVVGGSIHQAGGNVVEHIARWDGTIWHALPPITSHEVHALFARANGDLLVGRAWGLQRWDGTAWTALGLWGGVRTVAELANGDLVAGGVFTRGAGLPYESIARFDGVAWQALGTGCQGEVRGLLPRPNGDVIAAGSFALAGGRRVDCIGRWDGSEWSPLGRGSDGEVLAIATAPDGDVIAGGEFTKIDGVAARNVARSVGGGWQPIGAGTDGPVHAVLVLGNDEVLVGGDFQLAGGIAARNIARWTGNGWLPLGSGCNFRVHALAQLPGGDVVAAGEFTSAGGQSCNRVARWNGAAWSPMGGGVDNVVSALAVLANGDLVAGGEFAFADGVPARNVARWQGASWQPLGGGVPFAVEALVARPNGHLVAAGRTQINYGGERIAVFDGATWTTIATGSTSGDIVHDLANLPGGDLIAAGTFTALGGTAARNIMRWNGTLWSQLGSGLDAGANAVVTSASGELFVGGAFTTAGGEVSTRIAWLTPPCPATGQGYGNGCATSSGPLQLDAPVAPWIGGDGVLRGGPVPSGALAAGTVGLAPQNVPLVTRHPAAGAACRLLTTVDALVFVPAIGALASWHLPVPPDPALVGVQLYAQLLVGELAGNTLQHLSSSNGVALTIGTF